MGTDDATLAIYALDGTVRVFDRQTGVLPVSYTHLDVYKRQILGILQFPAAGGLEVSKDEAVQIVLNDHHSGPAVNEALRCV